MMSYAMLKRGTPDLDELSKYPLIPPPAGVESNFVDPESHNLPLFAVTSLLLGVMLLFALNRVYTKICIVRRYSWDDLTVILGVGGSVAFYVACIWGSKKGRFGFHGWDISILQSLSRNQTIPAYMVSILPPPTMLFIKITFFIMYLQIFRPMRWLRVCAYLGILVTSICYTTLSIIQFIAMIPRQHETYLSDQSSKGQRISLDLSVPQSAFGLVVDVYILVLPIIAVSKLQLPTRRKVGLIVLFMTGTLACLSSLLSIYYRYILIHSSDVLWSLMPVYTVTLVEMFVGIICACTPSAAKSYHHNLPSYKRLKSTLTSKFSLFGSLTSGDRQKSSFELSNKSQDNGLKPSHRQYSNIDVYNGPDISGLGQGKSLYTVIGSGTPTGPNNDGIHLTHEIQTTFS